MADDPVWDALQWGQLENFRRLVRDWTINVDADRRSPGAGCAPFHSGSHMDAQIGPLLLQAIVCWQPDIARWLVEDGGADVHRCEDEALRLSVGWELADSWTEGCRNTARWPYPSSLARWLIRHGGADAHVHNDVVLRTWAARGQAADVAWLLRRADSGVEFTAEVLFRVADAVEAAELDTNIDTGNSVSAEAVAACCAALRAEAC